MHFLLPGYDKNQKQSQAFPNALGDTARLPQSSGAPDWLIGLLPDGLFPGVIDPVSARKLDREAG